MPQTIDYAKRLVRGSSIVFLGLVAANFLGFLLRMFLTRTISVADYGLFFGVLAFISFIAIPGLEG